MTRDDRPGEAEELAELFHRHANGLAGAVRGILGEGAAARELVPELLQEAFLRAWRARARGIEPENELAWIFLITMNLARDQRRRELRRGPRPSLEEVDPMELRSASPAPEAGLEQAETLAAARAAIRGLRDSEKEVFLLRTSAGLSFQEAARALDIPVGTAKTRMRAALIHLRRSLEQFAPGALRSQRARRAR
ncbi:MAG: RNA polymerase sigma factor [Planctomycetota bacterium]